MVNFQQAASFLGTTEMDLQAFISANREELDPFVQSLDKVLYIKDDGLKLLAMRIDNERCREIRKDFLHKINIFEVFENPKFQ